MNNPWNMHNICVHICLCYSKDTNFKANHNFNIHYFHQKGIVKNEKV